METLEELKKKVLNKEHEIQLRKQNIKLLLLEKRNYLAHIKMLQRKNKEVMDEINEREK